MERPGEVRLVVRGQPLQAIVRTSRRARRLRMVVRPGRPLEVTVPRRTSRAALLRFLDDNAAWLAEKLAAAKEAAARVPTLGLERPGAVWLAGRPIAVEAVGGVASVAALRGERLRVSGPADRATAAIERWYRREARARLEHGVIRQADRLGLAPGRVAVRDQRTRWGSCSAGGTLSFNWRLVLAPAEVLEYVVVHELLHIPEPNHSRAFWRLLDRHRPGWQAQAEWLREHGPELLDYRVSSVSVPSH